MNCGKWCDSHSGDLLDALDVLEAHTKTYKPEQKKKQTAVDMCEVRERQAGPLAVVIGLAGKKVEE